MTETPQVEPPRAATRFTHASGSKPLAGYTIKRGIGRGGFGEVYYAVSDAGKEVALKLIKRHLDVELRGVRQCLNLKHPNLLALHDIRADAHGDRWVVMEHVAGESLEDAIERHPHGMPEAEALAWMRGAIAGVAYLHDHGIVHRDLKPGNIFRDEGVVKIGDYGLSKFVSCSRRSGQTESVGTVHYMAPEIANGRYGKEIDTYALGVILYETLTGRVPFEGESVGEVLMKHLTAEPDLKLLDEPYRAIVGRALAKDPEKRITSAKELLALLPSSGGFQPPEAANTSTAAGSHRYETLVAAEVVQAEAVDNEEPIWRTLGDGLGQLGEQWNRADLPPLVKAVALLGAAFVLLSSMGVWLPALIFGGIAYAIYRVVWELTRPAKAKPAPVVTARVAPAEPLPRERRCHSWRREKRKQKETPNAPVLKTSRQKLTELTGSMLLAAGAAVILTIVAMVLRRDEMRPEQFAWLALAGTLGAWAVMIPAKIWEGRAEEQTPRRFAMLVVGLGFGAAAFALADFLSVELPFEMRIHMSHEQQAALYEADGDPKLTAYLAYFGSLLFLLRWWRLADPSRGARLGLWATICCLCAAWLLNFVWPFPQPWGLMLVAIAAVSAQLASPWVKT